MQRDEASAVIAALEGAFDAAVEAAEDRAATDLAFSLAQDVPLGTEILRRGGSVHVGELVAPIATVAHDYLGCRAPEVLIPLMAARVRCPGFDLPSAVPDVFVSALRRLTRAGSRVVVGTSEGEFSGRLTKAAPDHVGVADGAGTAFVGVGEIRWVRLVRGGSVDAP